ncbi:MAG TPA: uracil-DNA glycosylase [Nitrososphaeraceae archaeon]|nr:uracil-DNA glycosylase [Nitrososphaeraceae archaeon]
MPSKHPRDPLTNLSLKIRGCTLCKLSRTRKNAVAGEGSCSVKVMIVGEAPGRQEDLEGKPFVGSSGRILDSALSKAGIKRSDVFITNVVKCRPPNNRRPQSNELIACMGHLERQISLVSPKIICILGSTAYRSLLGGKSIVADRGKIVEKGGKRYFLTVHPASTIYNRSLRSALENDLSILAREVRREPKRINKTKTKR